MSHTQGKLHFTEEPASEINDWVTSHVVRAPVNNFPLAVLSNYSGTEREANARRLVACWNACDGVLTEDVEAITGMDSFIVKFNEYKAQRNELLEALKFINMASCYASEENTDMYKDALLLIGNKARTTIQKTEGKV